MRDEMDELLALANDATMQIRIPGFLKARIEEAAQELEITMSDFVRDACYSYLTLSMPTLRYIHDASKIPAHRRAQWDMEHMNDEKYKRPMP